MGKIIILDLIILFCVATLDNNVYGSMPPELYLKSKQKSAINWPDFLSQHDMIWEVLPLQWNEGAFTGNGQVGMMIYATAWSEKRSSKENQSLLYVSIANKVPATNVSAGIATKAVIEALTLKPAALEKPHSDWWHRYYQQSFLSIPDARMESFYWIQMYKMALLCMHNYWLHYRYPGDLKSIQEKWVPKALKIAEAFEKFQQRNSSGQIELLPIGSPEYKGFETYPNTNYNLAILRWLLNALIESNEKAGCI